jgi:hypothetical protein
MFSWSPMATLPSRRLSHTVREASVLEIGGLQSGTLSNPRQHPGTNFHIIMEVECVVGPTRPL